MSWTPYHSLDLLALGLLPDRWDTAIRALLDAPERVAILPGLGGEDLRWSFDVVEGPTLDERLPGCCRYITAPAAISPRRRSAIRCSRPIVSAPA